MLYSAEKRPDGTVELQYMQQSEHKYEVFWEEHETSSAVYSEALETYNEFVSNPPEWNILEIPEPTTSPYKWDTSGYPAGTKIRVVNEAGDSVDIEGGEVLEFEPGHFHVYLAAPPPNKGFYVYLEVT